MKRVIVALVLMFLATIVGCVNDTGQWIDEAGIVIPTSNGTISASSNTTLIGLLKGNGSIISAVTAPSGTVVGTTDTQELTNKTLNAAVTKGNWTSSNWAIGSYDLKGTINISTGSIPQIYNYVDNNGFGVIGGTTTAKGAAIYCMGSGYSSGGGVFQLYTSNNTLVAFPRLKWGTGVMATANFTNTIINMGGINRGFLIDMGVGEGYYDSSIHSWVDISSSKFKINIKPLDNATSIIKQLKPSSFDWLNYVKPKIEIVHGDGIPKEVLKKDGYFTVGGATNQLGLIAEEVYKVNPALASVTDGQPTGINTQAIIALLVQTIKEQDERITALEKKLEGVK